ncbi:inositol monophosphatase [Pasteurellaceae bacterium LIM206]|nr:inositol monophosphatase [Pasteurellaceae bacterium LIM206]
MNVEIERRYLFSQQLVKEVGKTALDFYLNRDRLKIECKKGEQQDLVSIADKKVEEQIKAALKFHFPDDGFLGEESGADNLEREFCWVVDPIDGTSPFLYGLHAWCISIAVLHNKEIISGVIFDPLHNELFYAAAGQGAFLNGNLINTAKATSLKEGLMGLGVSHRVHPNTFTPVLQRILLDGGMFIRNGSGALMLAYVAAGRLIGYFEPHINAWDTFAGILLITEAGGKTNNFLENNGLLKGNFILAACSEEVFNTLNTFRIHEPG